MPEITARPLTAKGGIRAQTKSRKVGKNWWTKRWMSVLENYYMGAELPKGRAYAQAGQVLDINIENGTVNGIVQGAQKKPHRVLIRFKPAPKTQWERMAKTLSSQAIYAAKLLSGQMPEYIEDVFREQKLSLFPEKIEDLETSCDCESDGGACRCIIAVYYLLAEEFDRDPFLFMRLRGLDRDKLIMSIGASRKQARAKAIKSGYLDADFHGSPHAGVHPMEADFAKFWNGGVIEEDNVGDVRVPPTSGALSKHLGHFPMWRGEERFLDALDLVYKKASPNGMNVFMGDW